MRNILSISLVVIAVCQVPHAISQTKQLVCQRDAFQSYMLRKHGNDWRDVHSSQMDYDKLLARQGDTYNGCSNHY